MQTIGDLFNEIFFLLEIYRSWLVWCVLIVLLLKRMWDKSRFVRRISFWEKTSAICIVINTPLPFSSFLGRFLFACTVLAAFVVIVQKYFEGDLKAAILGLGLIANMAVFAFLPQPPLLLCFKESDFFWDGIKIHPSSLSGIELWDDCIVLKRKGFNLDFSREIAIDEAFIECNLLLFVSLRAYVAAHTIPLMDCMEDFQKLATSKSPKNRDNPPNNL